jgi:hypothetical protein
MNIHNNLNNSQLGYYLAGLIEGDGNIWTQKTIRSSKGRLNNPQVAFTFSYKDKPLYECIQKIFGSGSLYKVTDTNAFVYKISSKDTLIQIINLVNGKFRTPKIKYLHRAIDYLNNVYNTNIEKLPLDKSNLLDNPWLTGMADSDGNFHIALCGIYGSNNSVDKGRVICSFTLKQRMIDIPTNLSCIPFMTELADLFECKVNYKEKNEIVFVVQANSKHYLVKSYFDKFPLMSSKYLNYLCYLKGQSYLGRNLTNEEIIEIQGLKNSMNNKRTYFNWDHLNNFYK